MKLIVNGRELETHAGNVAALLDSLDYGERLVATARNGEFVPKDERGATALSDGDRVEIVAPMKGG